MKSSLFDRSVSRAFPTRLKCMQLLQCFRATGKLVCEKGVRRRKTKFNATTCRWQIDTFPGNQKLRSESFQIQNLLMAICLYPRGAKKALENKTADVFVQLSLLAGQTRIKGSIATMISRDSCRNKFKKVLH